jgi:hypothetical protein
MKTSHLAMIEAIFIVSVCGQDDIVSQYIKLYKTLEEKLYGKIRPVLNQSKSVTVEVDVHLLGIQELDEKEHILQSRIALNCRWKYETLKWNVSQYGGIRKLNFSPKIAWIPDIIISNSVDSMFVLTDNNGDMNRIKIMSNGDAEWDSGGNIRTTCRIDITKYPFDSQTCNIVIGKLEYDSEVYMSTSSENVFTTALEGNGEWKLKSALIKEKAVHHNVTEIIVMLTLSRYWFFYVVNIMLPVALLSIMMVLSFKIPPVSGERLGYNMALLLSFVVLLDLIGESMPRVSKQVSYLQLYVSYQLSMAVVITLLSILLVKFQFTKSEINIPIVIKLNSFFCRCKRQKSEISNNVNDNSRIDKPIVEKEETIQSEDNDQMLATDAAQIIERLCTWIFLAMFILSTILFLVVVAT